MKIVQMHLSPDGQWLACSRDIFDAAGQLVLVFWAGMEAQDILPHIRTLRTIVPNALVIGCSTGGIIQERLLLEEGLSATAILLEHSTLRLFRANIRDFPDSEALGQDLARKIPLQKLAHVLILADGLKINGSRLTAGLTRHLPPSVSITGGLAADGRRFLRTTLLLDEELLDGEVLCIGFYGDKLRSGFGSEGGFDPFGPERLITASTSNILHAVDGENVLALYERYLGKHARDLPASGHLFPMALRDTCGNMVIRSVMGVDRATQSLVFSGDMPLGATVQLMKSSMENIIEGAREAARKARLNGANSLALLVSCMGRKQGLRQFAEEEIDAVQTALPPGTAMAGFYSYGELAPCGPLQPCMLHNQTMTVTVFGEEY